MLNTYTKIAFLSILVILFFGKMDASASKTIKIGLVAPLNGQLEFLGQQILTGALAAKDRINQMGGVSGSKIEIIYRNDESNPATSVKLGNYLVEKEKVVAVIGHGYTSATQAASNIYKRYKVPHIALGDSSPALTTDNPYVFRLCGRYDRQGQIVNIVLSARHGNRGLASIYKGTKGKQISESAMPRSGFHFVQEISGHSHDQSISKLNFSGVKALLVAGLTVKEAVNFLRLSENRLGNSELVFDDIAAYHPFSMLGNEKLNGIIFNTNCYVPTRHDVFQFDCEYCAKQEDFQDLQQIGLSLHAHAAVELLAHSITKGGYSDRNSISSEMRKLRVETSIGTVSFNNQGDINASTSDGFTQQLIYGWYMYSGNEILKCKKGRKWK
ncbi:MAG: ABC transporter substrate-binding protein [Nitrospinae bacterium]|nr:ABC transporter substrate-binding protein [Nitrospinota bacterium]